jgi:hypothetical protein
MNSDQLIVQEDIESTLTLDTATAVSPTTAIPHIVYPELAGAPLGILNERQVDRAEQISDSPLDGDAPSSSVNSILEAVKIASKKEAQPDLLLPITTETVVSTDKTTTLAASVETTISQAAVVETETTSPLSVENATTAATSTENISTDTTELETSTQSNKRLKFRGQQFRTFSSSTTVVPLETEATRRTSFVPSSATEGRRQTNPKTRWVALTIRSKRH